MERGGWDLNVIWRWSGVDSIRSIGEEMNWNLLSALHMHRMSLPFGSQNPDNPLQATRLETFWGIDMRSMSQDIPLTMVQRVPQFQ